MSSRTATLVDLGLDLSDSDLEDTHNMDIQFTDSESSDECSSSDEELKEPKVELSTEVVSSPALSVVENSHLTELPASAVGRALGPGKQSSNVWSRLGERPQQDRRKVHHTSGRFLGHRTEPHTRRANGTRSTQLEGRGVGRRTPKPYNRHYPRDRSRHPEQRVRSNSYVRQRRWEASRSQPVRDDRGSSNPPSHLTFPSYLKNQRTENTKPTLQQNPDRIRPEVVAALRSIKERASTENIHKSYVQSCEVMSHIFDEKPFPKESNPWAPVLSAMILETPLAQDNPWLVGVPRTPVDAYGPQTHSASWDDVLRFGPVLYKTFQTNPRTASTAKIMRELVLRRESLIAALASTDELFTWCKMCVVQKLPLRTEDPIISTAGAILENLLVQLRPFVPCYLRARQTKTLDELCCRAQLSDVSEFISLIFVVLSRLAVRVRDSDGTMDYDVIGVEGDSQMDYYIPGACQSGVLEILATHRRECMSRICETVASQLVSSDYVHGKYFYCNSLC
ncbi:ICP27 [Macropodid alphaherpesvirus 2]|uniref:ICP27 n=1 Tax=Macropodid alphaherpesvirus 2 TaxID=83440 RepID=A0AAE7MLK3_9ALPH|nr:ICP27 [Macropodid alphaherpesvirus 2]QOD40216.1 ICP27 [Macropodid alphaherpesvirus 2]WGO49710.1 ICP27 [Macropodid alphaherpesvirus 2]